MKNSKVQTSSLDFDQRWKNIIKQCDELKEFQSSFDKSLTPEQSSKLSDSLFSIALKIYSPEEISQQKVEELEKKITDLKISIEEMSKQAQIKQSKSWDWLDLGILLISIVLAAFFIKKLVTVEKNIIPAFFNWRTEKIHEEFLEEISQSFSELKNQIPITTEKIYNGKNFDI